MSAFGYTKYGCAFGVAARAGGARISDKLMEATDRLAVGLFELPGAGNGGVAGSDGPIAGPLENTYNFLYPFVGGTQVAHSINLADPSKNRIQFDDDTTVTHNANGITGPGNVQLFPFEGSASTDADCSFGIYQRSGVSDDRNDIIAQQAASPTNIAHAIVCRRSTYGDTVYYGGVVSSAGWVAVANTNPQGFYTQMRLGATNFNVYKNGTNVGYLGTGQAGNTGTFYLFSGNSHNIAFCYLTKSYYKNNLPYTNQWNSSMYAVVQKFQTWCGRAV